MMSISGVESRSTLPPLARFAVTFLDPRRWLGILLAIGGIFLSVIVPLLPPSFVKFVSKPPAGAESSLRPTSQAKRPCPVPVQPYSSPPISANREAIRRPHTATDAPTSSRVTFTSDPPPPAFSTGSILVSSPSTSLVDYSSPFEVSPPPLQPDIETISEVSVAVSDDAIVTPSLLPPPSRPTSILNHPVGIQSLDSLDLAVPELFLPVTRNPRKPFRIPLPRLILGKRRSITDLKNAKDGTSEGSSQQSHEEKPKETIVYEDGWEGNEAFAVKRRNHTTSPFADIPAYTPTYRSKFSLFNRDNNAGKDKEKGKGKDPPNSYSQSSSVEAPPILVLPSPTTLDHMVSALTPLPTAGPSAPHAASPYLSQWSALSPLVPTTTPPARPARTDPYKTYGVPFPGSERARAFLKAEKEMRLERERRTRVEREKDNEPNEGSSGKDKENVVSVIEEAMIQETAGTVPQPQLTGREAQDEVDEYGVLSNTPAPKATRSHLRARSWGLSRRCVESSASAERREVTKKRWGRPENPGNDSDKDPPLKPFGLSKTTKGRVKRRPAVKERGYVSDTGVPSLTLKLM